MTDDELNAIEQCYLASSPGEWTYEASVGECILTHHEACPRGLETPDDRCPECEDWEIYSPAGIDGTITVSCDDYPVSYTDADMKFCVEAHQSFPALIAEIRRLRGENEKLSSILECGEAHQEFFRAWTALDTEEEKARLCSRRGMVSIRRASGQASGSY